MTDGAGGRSRRPSPVAPDGPTIWEVRIVSTDRSTAARSGGVTLTPTSAKALAMLVTARDEGRDPHGVIANTMDAPYLADGQVFLSISTGRALERRGLIRIEDEGDAYLT